MRRLAFSPFWASRPMSLIGVGVKMYLVQVTPSSHDHLDRGGRVGGESLQALNSLITHTYTCIVCVTFNMFLSDTVITRRHTEGFKWN